MEQRIQKKDVPANAVEKGMLWSTEFCGALNAAEQIGNLADQGGDADLLILFILLILPIRLMLLRLLVLLILPGTLSFVSVIDAGGKATPYIKLPSGVSLDLSIAASHHPSSSAS